VNIGYLTPIAFDVSFIPALKRKMIVSPLLIHPADNINYSYREC